MAERSLPWGLSVGSPASAFQTAGRAGAWIFRNASAGNNLSGDTPPRLWWLGTWSTCRPGENPAPPWWPWTDGPAGSAGAPWRIARDIPRRSWPGSDQPSSCWCGRPIAWWLSTRGQERKSGGCPSVPAATTWPSSHRFSTAAGCSYRVTGTVHWPAACGTIKVPRNCGGRAG